MPPKFCHTRARRPRSLHCGDQKEAAKSREAEEATPPADAAAHAGDGGGGNSVHHRNNAGRQPLADSHCPPARCCRRRRTCRPRGMPTRDSRRQHVYSPTRRNTMLASGWQRRSTQRALRPRVTTRLPRSPHRRHASRLGIRGQGGSCTSTWSWAWPGLVRCRGSRTAASLFLRYTDGTLIDDDAGPTTVQAFWDDRL